MNNIFEKIIVGTAIDAHATAGGGSTGTFVGVPIVEPWTKGRQLSFIMNMAKISTGSNEATTNAFAVQVRKRSDASWVALTSRAGTSITLTLVQHTTRIGTLELSEIDSDTYDAVRLVVVMSTAAACAASYIIWNLLDVPSPQKGGKALHTLESPALWTNPAEPSTLYTTDAFWALQRYG